MPGDGQNLVLLLELMLELCPYSPRNHSCPESPHLTVKSPFLFSEYLRKNDATSAASLAILINKLLVLSDKLTKPGSSGQPGIADAMQPRSSASQITSNHSIIAASNSATETPHSACSSGRVEHYSTHHSGIAASRSLLDSLTARPNALIHQTASSIGLPASQHIPSRSGATQPQSAVPTLHLRAQQRSSSVSLASDDTDDIRGRKTSFYANRGVTNGNLSNQNHPIDQFATPIRQPPPSSTPIQVDLTPRYNPVSNFIEAATPHTYPRPTRVQRRLSQTHPLTDFLTSIGDGNSPCPRIGKDPKPAIYLRPPSSSGGESKIDDIGRAPSEATLSSKFHSESLNEGHSLNSYARPANETSVSISGAQQCSPDSLTRSHPIGVSDDKTERFTSSVVLIEDSTPPNKRLSLPVAKVPSQFDISPDGVSTETNEDAFLASLLADVIADSDSKPKPERDVAESQTNIATSSVQIVDNASFADEIGGFNLESNDNGNAGSVDNFSSYSSDFYVRPAASDSKIDKHFDLYSSKTLCSGWVSSGLMATSAGLVSEGLDSFIGDKSSGNKAGAVGKLVPGQVCYGTRNSGLEIAEATSTSIDFIDLTSTPERKRDEIALPGSVSLDPDYFPPFLL